jgi:hypothetical protein
MRPDVFRFTARLVRGRSRGRSAAVLDVPKRIGRRLNGMEKVEGVINGHPFRAALEANAAGGRRVRVNDAMLRGARAKIGDAVTLAILGPEPEPSLPDDLRIAMAASAKAKTLWRELTLIGRLDWIRWIDSAKTPPTRARRVTRTVEQLSEGKRRPCCVNVYEFMLRRVQE